MDHDDRATVVRKEQGEMVFVFSLNNAEYEYLKHCVLLLYQYKIGKGDVVYRKLVLKLREQVD